LKAVLSRTAAASTAAMVATLSAVHGALAASTSSSLSPEYNEVLQLAKAKVEAATQPGAYGNGVPLLSSTSADPMSILPWIGIAVAVAITAVCTAKLLAPKMKSKIDAAIAK
jgi:hypothetical protein